MDAAVPAGGHPKWFLARNPPFTAIPPAEVERAVLSGVLEQLPDLVSTYGYWLVAIVIGLESMGLPLPGETTLIAASVYAGGTHRLSIALIILAGVAGAILGDNAGYWIGRKAGFRLLSRYGRRVGISEPRLRLGQYLFLRHGGKIVFLGRFVAVLRVLAALLAGALHMAWPRFLAFNVAAAIAWVGSFGLAAYLLGGQVRHLVGPLGIATLALAAIVTGYGFVVVRQRTATLQAAADAHFGPTAPATGLAPP